MVRLLVIVMVILTTTSSCCGHISGRNPYQETEAQVYCGRTLARVLAAVCFDFTAPEKRSNMGTMYGNIFSPYYKDQEGPYGWPWLTPQGARSLSLPSRGKRLVVNECCDKPCTINELWSYC